jgi:N-methylhydantoinase A
MAQLIRLATVEKGLDPRDFTLVAFGGGGPLHAASLATELRVGTVVIPRNPGLFSAWGMLSAHPLYEYTQTRLVRATDPDPLRTLNGVFGELEAQALDRAGDRGAAQMLVSRVIDMRYAGQEHTVRVAVPGPGGEIDDLQALNDRFHALHEELYTFQLPDAPVEYVTFYLMLHLRGETLEVAPWEHGDTDAQRKDVRRVWFADTGFADTDIYERDELGAGFRCNGPAIVEEAGSTTVVHSAQEAAVDGFGNIVIRTP